MNNKWKPATIRSSDITPEAVYVNRRQFMQGAALVAGGALLAACAPKAASTPVPTVAATFTGQQDELGNELTAYEAVTGYNNYYEFTTDKEGVAPMAQGLQDAAVDDRSERAGEQAAHLRHRRINEALPIRRAHLSLALRRSVVDGDSVERLCVEQAVERSRADGRREIRALRLAA